MITQHLFLFLWMVTCKSTSFLDGLRSNYQKQLIEHPLHVIILHNIHRNVFMKIASYSFDASNMLNV